MTGLYNNKHQTLAEQVIRKQLQEQAHCVKHSLEILDPDNYPASPDYTADGLMDIVVSRGLEAMARIEWEMSQGPEHLRHNFKVINDSVPGDPEDGCEGSGGRGANDARLDESPDNDNGSQHMDNHHANLGVGHNDLASEEIGNITDG